MASKRPGKQFEAVIFWSWDTGRREGLGGGGEVVVPQNIMRAHCAVIRPDHLKFASYTGLGIQAHSNIVGLMCSL